eukprot:CAMPEP_0196219634 /NCGR_PEP_ID=MMETSP0912-20130531/39238_1 /TAXON_ID=49265 /ORGANISM="Thalassiosira rotula, Strain GSO102" /LENGTH=33 /DNA_ID= /DNA_START= /DNA_END= /DNA_ORIENTATION=
MAVVRSSTTTAEELRAVGSTRFVVDRRNEEERV